MGTGPSKAGGSQVTRVGCVDRCARGAVLCKAMEIQSCRRRNVQNAERCRSPAVRNVPCRPKAPCSRAFSAAAACSACRTPSPHPERPARPSRLPPLLARGGRAAARLLPFACRLLPQTTVCTHASHGQTRPADGAAACVEWIQRCGRHMHDSAARPSSGGHPPWPGLICAAFALLGSNLLARASHSRTGSAVATQRDRQTSSH